MWKSDKGILIAGGRIISTAKSPLPEGAASVCLDDVAGFGDGDGDGGVRRSPCIMYSLDGSADVSLQAAMTEFGCAVHDCNFTWREAGDGATTLEREVEKNGHRDAKITYLKAGGGGGKECCKVSGTMETVTLALFR